jgi:fumarate reductase flavoprotein subunit
MMQKKSWDLVVMGAGIAGLTAAVRASQRGLKVLLLESGEHDLYLCNSRFTGGAFHIAFHDINEAPEDLFQAIEQVTEGFAHRGLADAMANQARHAVGWLRQQGARFIKAGPDAWRQNFLAPPGLLSTGLHWQGRGGDVTLRVLGQRLESLGGEWLRGWRGCELIMKEGVCTGLTAVCKGEQRHLLAQAVLLCDGGFQGNLELLEEFVSPAPQKLKQRGAATGVGDALRMGREIGAKLSGMENIYGHLLSQDALHDDRLWPYPILDLIAGAGVVINGAAERFMDEGRGGVFMTNCIARLVDPLSACVIFDKAIWDGPATQFILPANPHLVKAGGTIVAADTLSELADKLGLPADALLRTVSEYNRHVNAKHGDVLNPPRSSNGAQPFAVEKAPFYGVRLAAGITYTMGGLATDANAQVLQSKDDRPIAGLYAAGSCTGGLEGGAYAGYISGLVKASVMGLRAADHVAQSLGFEAPPGLATFGSDAPKGQP